MKMIANIAYGRFNPPHIGHEKLFNFGKHLEGEFFICPTFTKNNKTDPLSFDEKYDIIYQMGFGDYLSNLGKTGIFGIIDSFNSDEYDEINFIVGGDRCEEFSSLFKKYQKDYKSKLGVLNFAMRDKYNISATEMRDFCKIGDYQSFLKNFSSRFSPNQALEVYRKVSVALQGHVRPPHDKTRSVFFSKNVSEQ
jgi:hypothetical protein